MLPINGEVGFFHIKTAAVHWGGEARHSLGRRKRKETVILPEKMAGMSTMRGSHGDGRIIAAKSAVERPTTITMKKVCLYGRLGLHFVLTHSSRKIVHSHITRSSSVHTQTTRALRMRFTKQCSI
jgi:hypothetical protein